MEMCMQLFGCFLDRKCPNYTILGMKMGIDNENKIPCTLLQNL